MKKYLFLILAGIVGLSSCGDDDDVKVPKLNKLTKVSCYKNGETVPAYRYEIVYNQDGSIHYMQSDEQGRMNVQYASNSVTVTGTSPLTTDYTLKGNQIIEKKTHIANPYAANTVYVNEEYQFHYSGGRLAKADWTIRWPLEDGKTYELREYKDAYSYSWTGGSVAYFTKDKTEMKYEYGTTRPSNLPFVVPNHFAPVGFDMLDPLNLLYGTLNSQLPSRAYWYNVPEVSTILGDYSFSYSFNNDYLTVIEITEMLYTPEVAQNEYYILLEYSFVDP